MSDEDRPHSCSWVQDIDMRLAEDGEVLRRSVQDCAKQLGPVQPGWTRFARVMVADIPPYDVRSLLAEDLARDYGVEVGANDVVFEGVCGEPSPEEQLPCRLPPGHDSAHEAVRGAYSLVSWG